MKPNKISPLLPTSLHSTLSSFDPSTSVPNISSPLASYYPSDFSNDSPSIEASPHPSVTPLSRIKKPNVIPWKGARSKPSYYPSDAPSDSQSVTSSICDPYVHPSDTSPKGHSTYSATTSSLSLSIRQNEVPSIDRHSKLSYTRHSLSL